MIQKEKGKTILLPEYRTFWVQLNTQSQMEVAICSKCQSKLSIETIDKIMKRIKVSWQNELEECDMPEKQKKAALKYHKSLKTLSYKVETIKT